ncbi:glycosyltransferase family 4 protein, partial [Roseomonas sp. GC11]|uniref:glycosyltransferase family 4 protein n=1 Tax=Roseomonas sp. GC11 TaxID=2950546 RepID=UPI00210C7009
AAPQPPPPAAAPAPAPQPAAPQPAAPGQAAVLRLFLDVSDLLIYFAGARTPTGIQRVQMGIVSRAAAAPAPAGMAIALARYDADALCWRPVDKAAFTALCALASSGADAEAADWVTARDALYARTTSSAPIAFPEGAILVNLGNSWGLPDYFRALTAMRQRHGLRYLPFVHDCVPLIVPEHCQQSTVHDYARWFAAMALQADGLLCNSENTRRDVLQQLGRLMPGFSLPAHVVRLDADPRELVPETLGASGALRALRPGESFALFVATLESRKNHLLVFSAWLELLRRHGPARVPRLVCVGRAGWHAEPALSLLRSVPELQRHVLLLSGVSDQDLATLYAGCAFTLYNSHYEGWGLPVTEALAHGKVVITPRHSSLTEAGGEAALYFTPQSQPELVALVERVAFEPDFRAAQEAVARQKGQPRSWAAVKDNVLEAVAALARHPMRPAEGRMPLRLGQPYATQRACLPRPDITLAVAEAACQGPGWHRQEEWGLWCREGHATLRLPLPDEARGVPLRLYLDLRQPGEALVVGLRASLLQTNLLHASLGGAPLTQVELPLEGSGDVTFVVDLPAAHGTQPGVELELDLDNGPGVAAEGIAGLARTQIGAGLRGFMICRTDDHAARLAFLERKSFLSPGQ